MRVDAYLKVSANAHMAIRFRHDDERRSRILGDVHWCETPFWTSRSSSASTRGRYAYGTGHGLNTASGLKYRCPTCHFMQLVDGSNTSLNSFNSAVSRELASTLFTLTALNVLIHGSPNRARSFGDSTNTSGSLRRWLS